MRRMTFICLYHLSRFSFVTSTSRVGVSVRYPRKESSWSLTANGSECDASWCSCVESAAVWIVRAKGCNDCDDISSAFLCLELGGRATYNAARNSSPDPGESSHGGGGGRRGGRRAAGGGGKGQNAGPCRRRASGEIGHAPKSHHLPHSARTRMPSRTTAFESYRCQCRATAIA